MLSMLKSKLTGEATPVEKEKSEENENNNSKKTVDGESSSEHSPESERKTEPTSSSEQSTPSHEVYEDAQSPAKTASKADDSDSDTNAGRASPPPVRLQRRGLNEASSDEEDDTAGSTEKGELFKVTDSSMTESPTKSVDEAPTATDKQDDDQAQLAEEDVPEEQQSTELAVTSPLFVPRNERYYLHDSRYADCDGEDDEEDAQSALLREREANRMRKARSDVAKWSHDMYDDNMQMARTKEEVVVKYGYDIRDKETVPDDQDTIEAALNARRETLPRTNKPKRQPREHHRREEDVVNDVVDDLDVLEVTTDSKPKRQRQPRRRKPNTDVAEPVEVIDDGDHQHQPARQSKPRRNNARLPRHDQDEYIDDDLHDQEFGRRTAPPAMQRQSGRGRGGRGRGAPRGGQVQRSYSNDRVDDGYRATRGGYRGRGRGGQRGGRMTQSGYNNDDFDDRPRRFNQRDGENYQNSRPTHRQYENNNTDRGYEQRQFNNRGRGRGEYRQNYESDRRNFQEPRGGGRGGYNRDQSDNSNDVRGGQQRQQQPSRNEPPQSKRYSQRNAQQHNGGEQLYDRTQGGGVKPNVDAFPPLGGGVQHQQRQVPLPQRPRRQMPLGDGFDPSRPPPQMGLQGNQFYQNVARPMPPPNQQIRPKQPTDAVYFDPQAQRERQKPLQARPSKGIPILSPEHQNYNNR